MEKKKKKTSLQDPISKLQPITKIFAFILNILEWRRQKMSSVCASSIPQDAGKAILQGHNTRAS